MPAMVYCVAYGCRNKTTDRKPGISFHRFPRNERRLEAWTKAVSRENWKPSASSSLCSAHFEERFLDHSSLVNVRLRENAIPSIFPAEDTSTDKDCSKARRRTRKRFSSDSGNSDHRPAEPCNQEPQIIEFQHNLPLPVEPSRDRINLSLKYYKWRRGWDKTTPQRNL